MQNIFHEKYKKNSRQNEVSFTYFFILNNIRLIYVSIDNKNSFIIFKIPEVLIWEYVPEVFIWDMFIYLSSYLSS